MKLNEKNESKSKDGKVNKEKNVSKSNVMINKITSQKLFVS